MLHRSIATIIGFAITVGILGGCYVPRLTRTSPELKGEVINGDRPVANLTIAVCSTGATLGEYGKPPECRQSLAATRTDASGRFHFPATDELGARFVAADLPGITWDLVIHQSDGNTRILREDTGIGKSVPDSVDVKCDLAIPGEDRCRLYKRLRARVLEVISPNTLLIHSFDNRDDRALLIKFAWIDTTPFDRQSREHPARQQIEAYLKPRVVGKDVNVVKFRHYSDAAIVYVADVDVGLEMVKDGMAQYTTKGFPPQMTIEQRQYSLAAELAKRENRGPSNLIPKK